MKKTVNRLFKAYYKHRIGRIQKYMESPHSVQYAVWKELIHTAKNTEWGKQYDFKSIKTPQQFADRIPIQDYETLKPYIERMMHGERDVLWHDEVRWFSKSAGTTNDKSKFIPVSTENLKQNHIRGTWDTMNFFYDQRPDARQFECKSLLMGGNLSQFGPHPRTTFGDVSAIMMHHMPWVARPFFTPDFETALMSDFGEKIEPCVPKGKFKQYKKHYSNALKGESQEFEGVLVNTKEEEVWVETFLSPIKIEGRGISEISCLAHEVTDKKLAFSKLRKSLREKEVLLQEVHHRVKNNLQVISSILNLQSSYVDEPKMLDMLKESQNRIRSMSYVHESLYLNKDLSHIDLSDYVQGLARNLIHSYANDKKIELNTKLTAVQLNLDQAIPCGLLMNELITNALKYAYPKGGEGIIYIEVREVNGKAVIRVGDSGVGMPNGTDISDTPSLGLQLVSTLIEQLDGSVELEPKKGTNYLITFDLIK